MEHQRTAGLTDEQLETILNESEFEDEDSDTAEPFPEDLDHLCSTTSESEAEPEATPQPVQIATSLRRVRTRGGYRSRGRVLTRGGRAQRFPVTPENEELWGRRSFTKSMPHLQEPSYPSNNVNSEDLMKYLNEYIDDNLIDTIVQKTNQTSIEKTGRSINLTREECYIYFGITLLMACLPLSQIRIYWNQKYALPVITQAMTRDRYFLLRNSMKVVFDNDITMDMRKQDKLWKVRPLLDRILQGCKAQGRQQKISIDEMIIPFTGACPIRQYCPGKPHPTGMKAFVLANPNGLVCDLTIYQGKETFAYDNQFHLGENVVLKLTESLVPGHLIYFDRYFTTVRLADELAKRGLKCTGTIMKNRVPKEVINKIDDDKTLMRKGRGSCDVLVRNDGEVAFTKWMDNKSVLLLSTIHAAENFDDCRRYNRSTKQYLFVSRPEVIKEYNSNMGGVDLTDRLIAVCPSRARTRKWTVRFISHCLDLSITNSWIKFKQEQIEKGIRRHKIVQLREFKRLIAERLIEENLYREDDLLDDSGEPEERRNVKKRRPPIVPLPSKLRRKHGTDHLPDIMLTTQSRCRNEGCSKKTSVKCLGCNLSLCLTAKRNCFKLFHNSD
ncbi:unnamed protein product [Colias eurytheme]|nr:unnamed protein product [Colias eurytheme]